MGPHIELKVKIGDLITHIQNNKTKHVEEYKRARQEYFSRLQEKLRDLTTSAANFLDGNYNINLVPPVDAAKNYDKYIGFLSMSTETEMTISSDDYACFVEDNWTWAQAAKLSNAVYINN